MTPNHSAASLSHFERMVRQLTGGRPWVFVIMPYDEKWEVFERIRDLSENQLGMACLRADDVPRSGHDLLSKVQLLIERAEVVIADIGTKSENVFYEVGYTVAARQESLILINDAKNQDIPTDLKGLELITYGGSRDEVRLFKERLAEHMRLHLTSDVSLRKDMLLADAPRPTYIVASPKTPTEHTARARDRRTFGDNLGIRDLISAFGSILGENTGVELISAVHFDPALLSQPLNLFLIGSPKNNPLTEQFMDDMQGSGQPLFSFGPKPGHDTSEDDYPNVLYRSVNGQPEWVRGKIISKAEDGATREAIDHGIIIRGPHPHYSDRIVMILAGAHSLGTGAACLAATRSKLIEQINEKLPDAVSVADKDATFWVLVQGHSNPKDAHLNTDGVTILEAGLFE